MSSKQPNPIQSGPGAAPSSAAPFQAAPSMESGKTPTGEPKKHDEEPTSSGSSNISTWFMPGIATLLQMAEAEERLGDRDTLGPDAFISQKMWINRGIFTQSEPEKPVKIIDVQADGAKLDRGDSSWSKDDLEPLLSTPMPKGRGVCRIIIGPPESGRLDRRFAVNAVNLAKEKAKGVDNDFEEKHFVLKASATFDLARLRSMWNARKPQWTPFAIWSLAPRVSIEGQAFVHDAWVYKVYGNDVFNFYMSWIMVQTIPLENDRFIILCALPWKKFYKEDPAATFQNFAEMRSQYGTDFWENMDEKMPHLYEILSRGPEQSYRERFESLLLSEDSSTSHSNNDAELLCQLILLDLFRAGSDSWTRLQRDFNAQSASLDEALYITGDAQSRIMESKGNYNFFGNFALTAKLWSDAADHLLKAVSMQVRSSPSSPSSSGDKIPFWLEHIEFGLRGDFEHTRNYFEQQRDVWQRRWTDAHDLAQEAESKNVERLTLVAAIFLPLGLGADLLGMQFRLRDLHLILYDYLGLVVSTGLVIYVGYKFIPAYFLLRRTYTQNRQKKRDGQSPLRLWRTFLQSYSPIFISVLWGIITGSFMVGMTGSIDKALEVLKYGVAAWGGFFVFWALVLGIMAWVGSIAWKMLHWKVVN